MLRALALTKRPRFRLALFSPFAYIPPVRFFLTALMQYILEHFGVGIDLPVFRPENPDTAGAAKTVSKT